MEWVQELTTNPMQGSGGGWEANTETDPLGAWCMMLDVKINGERVG